MIHKKTGEIFSDLLSKTDVSVKICFISGIISGFLAHIYALTNHLYNYDEIWWTPTGIGTGIEQGRWGLSLMSEVIIRLFNNTYTLPVLNGSIAIAMYTLAACLVVSLFKIKDKVYAAATGALFVVFPTVVSRMFFMFTTHAYAIGVFCAVFSAWLVIKFHKKWYCIFTAILLLAFATAVYQANFASAVCTVVGFLIADYILKCDGLEIKPAIIRCCNYLIYLASGIILYFIINKLALALTHQEMSPMEGYDSMGHLSLSNILTGLRSCYTQFVRLCYGDVYSTNPTVLTKITFLVTLIIFAYAVILIIKKSIPLPSKVFILLLFIILPVAINLIVIMASSSYIMYTIMRYESVFIFAAASSVIEQITAENPCTTPPIRKFPVLLHNIYGICMIVSVLVYIWFANGNYIAMQYTNDHDYAYYLAVMTQIKSLDGYHDDMPVIYLGYPVHDSSYNMKSMIGDTFNAAGKRNTNTTGYSGHRIFRVNLGFNPEVRNSDEDEEYFSNHPQVKDMPCYPDSGSMAIIDDTVVVKFDGKD